MSTPSFVRIGTLKTAEAFCEHLAELRIDLPCDDLLQHDSDSPLAQPIDCGRLKIGNRFTIHPMEDWDGTTDGQATSDTIRRWKRFDQSGAKLIWGDEAAASRH